MFALQAPLPCSADRNRHGAVEPNHSILMLCRSACCARSMLGEYSGYRSGLGPMAGLDRSTCLLKGHSSRGIQSSAGSSVTIAPGACASTFGRRQAGRDGTEKAGTRRDGMGSAGTARRLDEYHPSLSLPLSPSRLSRIDCGDESHGVVKRSGRCAHGAAARGQPQHGRTATLVSAESAAVPLA